MNIVEQLAAKEPALESSIAAASSGVQHFATNGLAWRRSLTSCYAADELILCAEGRFLLLLL